MKIDTNPGVLFLAYTTPEAWYNLQLEMNKRGYRWRELKLIDVSFTAEPDKYDEQVNFFKHFITPQNKRLIESATDNFFIKKILNKVSEKTNYKLMNNLKWDWERDKSSPFLMTLLMPLAREYKKENLAYCETEEEKQNYEKLTYFESKGYLGQEENKIKKINEYIDGEVKQMEKDNLKWRVLNAKKKQTYAVNVGDVMNV